MNKFEIANIATNVTKPFLSLATQNLLEDLNTYFLYLIYFLLYFFPLMNMIEARPIKQL